MKRDASLLVACALGPATFFLLLVVAYGITPGAHEHRDATTLRILHGIGLLVVLGGLALSVRELQKTAGDTGDPIVQRRRFLAILARGVSVLSLLLVLGMTSATLILLPGAVP